MYIYITAIYTQLYTYTYTHIHICIHRGGGGGRDRSDSIVRLPNLNAFASAVVIISSHNNLPNLLLLGKLLLLLQ